MIVSDHDESEEEVSPPKQAAPAKSAPANATPAAPAKEAGMVKAKEESGEDDFDSQEVDDLESHRGQLKSLMEVWSTFITSQSQLQYQSKVWTHLTFF